MSVDVKDHRKFLRSVEEKEKEAELEQPKHLMEQRTVANETGDPRLDKLMRVVAAQMEAADAHSIKSAMEGMGCLKDEMIRLKQLEVAFTKGRIVAYTEVLSIPAQIIMEERGSSSVSH